jgi:hypothetical protein
MCTPVGIERVQEQSVYWKRSEKREDAGGDSAQMAADSNLLISGLAMLTEVMWQAKTERGLTIGVAQHPEAERVLVRRRRSTVWPIPRKIQMLLIACLAERTEM